MNQQIRQQVVSWGLAGILGVGHVVNVQLPWHAPLAPPAAASTTTTLPVEVERGLEESLCQAGDIEECENVCDPEDGLEGGC